MKINISSSKIIYSILLYFGFQYNAAAQQDTIYFDIDWKETAKKHAIYYRLYPKNGENYQISDYYMSGKIQFTGLSANFMEPFILLDSSIWYYENGQREFTSFHQNGKREGTHLEYYSTGQLMAVYHYQNGEVHGKSSLYYPSGQLYAIHHFSKDTLQGEYQVYDESGSLLYKGFMQNNLREGKCYVYNSATRTILEDYTIRDGKLHDKYYAFDLNGNSILKAAFKHGIPVAYDLEYKLNDMPLKKTLSVVKGVEHWKTYIDGKLAMKSYYKNGIKTGTWEIFNRKTGAVCQSFTFHGFPECSDKNVQEISTEFSPGVEFSTRFYISYDEAQPDSSCISSSRDFQGEDLLEHPFYYLSSHASQIESEPQKNNLADEPISDYSFYKNKKCTLVSKDVYRCSEVIDQMIFTKYISGSKEALSQIRDTIIPQNNEIIFFYQKLGDKKYDAQTDSLPERYLDFKTNSPIRHSLRKGKIANSYFLLRIANSLWPAGRFPYLEAEKALIHILE